MSRVKLLLNVVTDLNNLSESVQAIAGLLESNEKESSKKQQSVKAEKQISLEEVRAVLAEKSHDGFTAEVRALLQKYGASKLSEIDPSKYAALLADAEELK
ncbi:rRNA biogenesis protein rrp5 [Alkalihalobacillus oceani]|uniref:rRNA biogenesis protein rrp5 n=1 Tax=Halalkalibacter oceani TaxID=1653776 RepID=UPI002041DDB1|nr:rRNA biogenesis protein rrp5 [Halalkalibacter oceani]MCM3761059.1 rRNA biogenesis protein rrp5 [Halalkalibacter oceani]